LVQDDYGKLYSFALILPLQITSPLN